MHGTTIKAGIGNSYGVQSVSVDLFQKRQNKQKSLYFLSHFHADHYGGLSATWKQGTIYCSPVTATLLKRILHIQERYVKELELNLYHVIEGIGVTLLDANHCPGAVMFLFDIQGKLHLHTGDFRYHPRMMLYPSLAYATVDSVYLDTTYCNPKYVFPAQEETVNQIIDIISRRCAEEGSFRDSSETIHPFGRTLFFISAYSIGKEQIFLKAATACGLKIFADKHKKLTLDCLALSSMEYSLFTNKPHDASIHIVSMGFLGTMFPYYKPNFKSVESYLSQRNLQPFFNRSIGFIPTGWANCSNWNKKNSFRSRGNHEIYLIPYSEHSSYEELKQFITFLNAKKLIPTVYADEKEYNSILELFEKYETIEAFFEKRKRSRAAPASIEDDHTVTTYKSGAIVKGKNFVKYDNFEDLTLTDDEEVNNTLSKPVKVLSPSDSKKPIRNLRIKVCKKSSKPMHKELSVVTKHTQPKAFHVGKKSQTSYQPLITSFI